MSDCNDALHQLYVYLDGELTEERRSLIQHHLDGCGPCVAAFDFEVELRQVVAAKCKEQVPDHLKRRIADALAETASSDTAGTGDAGGREDRASGAGL